MKLHARTKYFLLLYWFYIRELHELEKLEWLAASAARQMYV